MTEKVQLATALNPMAAKLIERYQITDEKLAQAKDRKWTKATYAEYLKTDHWQAFRLRVLKHYKNKCMLCGSQERLEVHHNDYTRLGGELMTDCLPLCQDCHERHHSNT